MTNAIILKHIEGVLRPTNVISDKKTGNFKYKLVREDGISVVKRIDNLDGASENSKGEVNPDTESRNLDRHCATDLVITRKSCEVHIAKRVRSNEYLVYSHEFTLRDAELQKILNGHGDYFFYFFLNEGNTAVVSYYIVDLQTFRDEDADYKRYIIANHDTGPFWVCPAYRYPASAGYYIL